MHLPKLRKRLLMINLHPRPVQFAQRDVARNRKSPRLDSILSSWVVPVNDWQTCQAPTKKELREARRETARMRSDMRASISTDATRHLDIKDLLKRFDVLVLQLYYYVIASWHSRSALSQEPTCALCTTSAASIVGI